MEPAYVKAHYRLTLAQQGLGKLERALANCRAGLELQPDSGQLTALEAELSRALGVDGSAPRVVGNTGSGDPAEAGVLV